MRNSQHLTDALEALGALLEDRGLQYDLVVVGGAALLLQDLVQRPTEDMDVIGQVAHGRIVRIRELAPELQQAVLEVGRAFDLPLETSAGRAWVNTAASFLAGTGLPVGFEGRLQIRSFGGLTVRLASRLDMIHLKLLAATATARGRQAVDLADLRALEPTPQEWWAAIRWCERIDGRPDFFEFEARPVLGQLGITLPPEDPTP